MELRDLQGQNARNICNGFRSPCAGLKVEVLDRETLRSELAATRTELEESRQRANAQAIGAFLFKSDLDAEMREIRSELVCQRAKNHQEGELVRTLQERLEAVRTDQRFADLGLELRALHKEMEARGCNKAELSMIETETPSLTALELQTNVQTIDSEVEAARQAADLKARLFSEAMSLKNLEFSGTSQRIYNERLWEQLQVEVKTGLHGKSNLQETHPVVSDESLLQQEVTALRDELMTMHEVMDEHMSELSTCIKTATSSFQSSALRCGTALSCAHQRIHS